MHFCLTNEAEALSAFKSFCRIWGSGGCGSLHLETQNEEVTIKLEQHLGPLLGLRPGPIGREAEKPPSVKYKSPSQLRRHERRRQEALSKAATKASEAEENIHKSTDDDAISNSDKVQNVFKCDQCDYTNKTEKGLKQHTRMKHKIPETPEMERQNFDEPELHLTPPKEAREEKCMKCYEFVSQGHHCHEYVCDFCDHDEVPPTINITEHFKKHWEHIQYDPYLMNPKNEGRWCFFHLKKAWKVSCVAALPLHG